ncbi:thiol reductant ABC exporter subunit CydD [Rhodococcoides corynebacterioides]|uniref:thiol reductant ABC exporter subunit CydD n=1 Tax=Rhodococcoides corynebacterioides TaxID=53972 RepID=UPI001C9B5ADA|nr:thiol reductant ABC exporter subunit CydD [Rhodococcus corynebacterioides]MBY6348841.1 thiol reductant ABC exporter subunit CydD [Rhodococcus corynebacterioides]
MTRRRRGPVDARLWTRSAAGRRYLVASTALSLVTTVCVVVIAIAVGTILAGVVTDPLRRTPGAWTVELSILGVAVVGRVLATLLRARIAHRAATRVVQDLTAEALDAAARIPERRLADRRAEWTTVLTRGLDGLRPYLIDYVPSLLLAATVTPAALAVVAWFDPLSAVVVAVTLPTIPVFMILIGRLTEGRSRRTLDATAALAGRQLDLLAGVPTLRALGRERGPEARVAELGDRHRRTTMRALRTAFLSSMVLELLASLGVALVAVTIGLRLVRGEMELAPGIVALILAPEIYFPLRAVGAAFHASEDGAEAADRVFALLDEDADRRRTGSVDPPVAHPLRWHDVTVDGRDGPAPDGLSAECRPGEVTVLTGPNGSGKSTALAVALGLTDPDRGHVTVGDVNLADLDLERWWASVAWLPQRPAITAGTIRDNVWCDDDELVASAASTTGLDAVVASAPNGWGTRLGDGGDGLSLGERQRLALTRTLASSAPVLLLDEPTAHLDSDSAAAVLAALVRLADEGRAVVIVGHTPDVLAAGDRIVTVSAPAARAVSSR